MKQKIEEAKSILVFHLARPLTKKTREELAIAQEEIERAIGILEILKSQLNS